MFDPYDPSTVQRLYKNIRRAHDDLQQFREKRTALIKDYVGSKYSENGADFDMPVNMLALTVDVYLMYLAGNRPQVILPTTNMDVLPYVADLEAVVNQELEDMNLDSTIRRWVLDAFFCLGVLKCGLVDSGYVELMPGQPQPGQEFFADVIDFDDFVYDRDARSWDKITFIGDRYLVDIEQLHDDPTLIKSGVRAVKPAEQTDPYSLDAERASDISQQGDYEDTQQTQALKPKGRVWDVCLPEERLVITLADSEHATSPIKVVEWDGPHTSPYHTLMFTDVPGQTMPLAPGMLLASLNRSLNALYRKLVQQAKRQKSLGLYQHGNQDDAKAVQKASDGDLVAVEHPDTVKEVHFGGASQENMAFALGLRDVYSQMAGNLDALGGLGPQSETFRQDAMIQSTVSKKSAKMTRVVVDSSVKVIEELIYRIWTDPVRTYTAQRDVANTGIVVNSAIEPGEKQFSLDDIKTRIEPYSMQYKAPQERAQELTGLITTIALPMLPFLQQQGIGLNTQALFEYLAKYMSLPELNQILEFTGPPTPGTSSSTSEPMKPPVTHRTYERVNRPGATRQGNTQTMMQAAAGANPQESQRAALSRPTGV